MFSGIVEETAVVTAIEHELDNVHFTLKCSFVDELGIDQSVAHNGVCLTVVSIRDGQYTVTAMRETLERSNLGQLRVGDEVTTFADVRHVVSEVVLIILKTDATEHVAHIGANVKIIVFSKLFTKFVNLIDSIAILNEYGKIVLFHIVSLFVCTLNIQKRLTICKPKTILI